MHESLTPLRPVRLLVSVRSGAEALLAAECGADLIDVKEPRRGSLGAARPGTVERVVRRLQGRATISAALGELVDWRSDSPLATAWERVASAGQWRGLEFLKIGLAGAGSFDWRSRWAAAVSWQPAGISRVAVIYADGRAAQAPSPRAVLRQACRLGCRAVLIDTYRKDRGSLLDIWPGKSLGRWISDVRHAGLQVVVAGSLTRERLEDVVRLGPDMVAVRGAVCTGDRTGRLSAAKLSDWIRRPDAVRAAG